MGKYSKDKQVHNADSAWAAKVELRRHILEAVGRDRAVVFDAFGGPGLMYRELWHEAAEYVGCDMEWFGDRRDDDRVMYVADNRRVLRAINLDRFTIFDLDSFGSPWEQALIVAARRRRLQPGERIGLLITDGSSLKLRLASDSHVRGSLPYALMEAANLSRALGTMAGRDADDVMARALAGVVQRMGGRVTRQWLARGTTSSQMRYVAAVVDGV